MDVAETTLQVEGRACARTECHGWDSAWNTGTVEEGDGF